MTKAIEWTKEQLDFLRENYIYKSLTELERDLGIGASVIRRKAVKMKLVAKKNQTVRIEHEFGMPLCDLLRILHLEQDMSVNQMAKKMQVSRLWINQKMEECGIVWRGQSDAGRLKWSKMTTKERKAQTEAAHKRTSDLWQDGEHPFQKWAENNPEIAKETRRRAALKLVEVREANGNNAMKGKVGPLHHGWKGEKDEYHRIRSTVKGNWWVNRKKALERDNFTCQQCGVNEENAIIDVHHIVELRAGGTNLVSNLICYCRSCHMLVEKGRGN